MITVTSPLLPDLDEFSQMLRQIWDNKWITNNGAFHKQLEKALAEYLKVPFVSLFTNGRPNAAVFPVPVRAFTAMFVSSARSLGRIRACTGVVWVNPFFSIAFRTASESG